MLLTLETNWVPVSEELPKHDGYYTVMEKSGRIGTYVFYEEGTSNNYWRRNAVAWLPSSLKPCEVKEYREEE